MSSRQEEGEENLTIKCPKEILENITVTLSKGIEGKNSYNQWLFRSLYFTHKEDDELEQIFRAGDLVEYKNFEGFLNGRAIFLCLSQDDHEYKSAFLASSSNTALFYVSHFEEIYFELINNK